MLNEINLIGRCSYLGVKYTPQGASVFDFGVITNESYKQKDGTWKTVATKHKCHMWGDRGVEKSKRMQVGTLVHIKGKLKIEEKTDDATGKTIYYPSITCDRIITLAKYIGDKSNSDYDKKFEDIAAKNKSVTSDVDDFNIFKETNEPSITTEDLPF